MAKKSKNPIKKLITLVSRILIIGLIIGGYYVYKNPDILKDEKVSQSINIRSEIENNPIETLVGKENISEILGKTTSLVEEGLQNIKVPKKITGTQEEIVVEEAFQQFSQKVKDLPEKQVDRIRIEFCKDVLEPVDNASVLVDGQ